MLHTVLDDTFRCAPPGGEVLVLVRRTHHCARVPEVALYDRCVLCVCLYVCVALCVRDSKVMVVASRGYMYFYTGDCGRGRMVECELKRCVYILGVVRMHVF